MGRHKKIIPEVTEQFLFENGYWKLGDSDTIINTPKWSALMQECFDRNTKVVEVSKDKFMNYIKIITPEDLVTGIMLAKRKTPRYKDKTIIKIYTLDGNIYNKHLERPQSKNAADKTGD